MDLTVKTYEWSIFSGISRPGPGNFRLFYVCSGHPDGIEKTRYLKRGANERFAL